MIVRLEEENTLLRNVSHATSCWWMGRGGIMFGAITGLT